jgi:serine/threonine protein kinase
LFVLCFQDSLFTRIQDGAYEFPEEEWGRVSEQAKDLIRHLLVRDPMFRYTAAEVLQHEWVSMESPCAQLATPQVLQRNNSVNGLEAFAESANAVNRMIQRHLSISEAFEPLSHHVSRRLQHEQSLPVFTSISANDKFLAGDESPPPDNAHHEAGDAQMFFIGDVQEVSDEEQQQHEHPSIMWMALTPPGESNLARRRRAKLSHGDSSENSSSLDEDMAPIDKMSPHKVPSAMF